jgi:transposase
MSVTEQTYKAVLAVIADGRTVTEVAKDWGVSRQTMHSWLARYEEEGLEGLNNRSHRQAHSPHQIPAVLEAMVLEMRRAKPYWGARRLALELRGKAVEPAASESAVYRCLIRAGVIDPQPRRWRRETCKRWERAGVLWSEEHLHRGWTKSRQFSKFS